VSCVHSQFRLNLLKAVIITAYQTFINPFKHFELKSKLDAKGSIHFVLFDQVFITKLRTILNNGYLGSDNDEERSEMRYVMRIAELSESSNL
jgi:hypothetical protein